MDSLRLKPTAASNKSTGVRGGVQDTFNQLVSTAIRLTAHVLVGRACLRVCVSASVCVYWLWMRRRSERSISILVTSVPNRHQHGVLRHMEGALE